MCDRGVISSIAGKQDYVDARILSQAPNEAPRELREGFQPGPRDVICSRGTDCFNNPGNRIFRTKLSEHLQTYSQASNKMSKGIIVSAIIDEIRDEGGAFVRQDLATGRWFEVGDRLAREKTGQALRSALRKSFLSAGKAAVRKCDSPTSMKSSESTASQPSPPRSLNMFGAELSLTDSVRTANASPIWLQLPTTLNALSVPYRHRGSVQLSSSRTWSGDGDAVETLPLGSAPKKLRRSITDPSQLGPDCMSFCFPPPKFVEEQVSSAFVQPPPPDLQRQTSSWSSTIDRLPGLLDYDPYPSNSAEHQAPPALRRGSSDFVGIAAANTRTSSARHLGIPLEISLPVPEGSGPGALNEDLEVDSWNLNH
jgi:hypothetical protein